MSLIGIGQSGLAAAYAQLQTTGNNIANVNTPGYVRQEVLLENAGDVYTGSGSVGRGVAVTGMRRNYDQYLAREATLATALAGADSARATGLDQLDRLLSGGDDTLGAAIDDLRTAFADLVNQPNDPSAREVVLRRADALAARFRETSDEIARMAETTTQKLGDSAAYVNTRLESIAAINGQIAQQNGTGNPSSDLLDRRDLLIDEVAAKLQVSRRDEGNGTVSLFSASGHALVLSGTSAKLVTQADASDPTRTQLAIRVAGTAVPLDAAGLGSGEMAGLLRFRDEDLTAAQARVGQLAAAVAGAYNAQQALGVDANGNAGSPLFATAAPQAVAASTNVGDAEFSVTVEDPSRLAATDYRLTFDGATYRMENLVDGTVRTLPGFPATIDGLRIELSEGAMTIGDRVTIQGASRYASDLQRAMSAGSGLATALAASPQLAGTNTGTVSVADFRQVDASPDAAAGVTITFTTPTTYDVSGPGTGGATGVPYVPGPPIEFNGWRLTLQGTPAAGDAVAVGPTADTAADNRNARALLGLGEQPLVAGARFTDAFAAMIADVGSRAAQGKTAAETSVAMRDRAQAVSGSASGVNLDEEAARLLQYQQAYQASARVIATANSLFDTIIAMVSRS